YGPPRIAGSRPPMTSPPKTTSRAPGWKVFEKLGHNLIEEDTRASAAAVTAFLMPIPARAAPPGGTFFRAEEKDQAVTRSAIPLAKVWSGAASISSFQHRRIGLAVSGSAWSALDGPRDASRADRRAAARTRAAAAHASSAYRRGSPRRKG